MGESCAMFGNRQPARQYEYLKPRLFSLLLPAVAVAWLGLRVTSREMCNEMQPPELLVGWLRHANEGCQLRVTSSSLLVMEE